MDKQVIVLPLYNHTEQPYWYFDTEKMMELCQNISPANTNRTEKELTQEAFYSAALDGEKDYASTQQSLSYALQRLSTPVASAFLHEVVAIITGAPPSYRSTTSDAAPAPDTIPWHFRQGV